MQRTPLSYLMSELGLKAADWQKLSEKDREDLKQYAAEEIAALGL